MTTLLVSEKYELWQRYLSRFGIKGRAQTPQTLISTIIVPVTDADRAIEDIKSVTDVKNLSAAAGTPVPYHTVPDGKVWEVMGLYRTATTANSNIYYSVGRETGIYLNLSDPGTAAFQKQLSNFRLPAKSVLGLVTTGAADTAVHLRVHYAELDKDDLL